MPDEYEEMLLNIAYTAVKKVTDVYKRKSRKGRTLKRLELLISVVQQLEVLTLRS